MDSENSEINLTEEEALQIAIGSLGEQINSLRAWLNEVTLAGGKIVPGLAAKKTRLARMVAAKNVLDERRACLRVDRVMVQVHRGGEP